MKLTTLAALSLCSTLTAQTFVSSPPGFLSLEGYGRCAHFGDAPDFRSMIVDGTHLGGARNLRSVSLRRKPFVATLVPGVIWGNVTLDVSLGVSKMTRTFSSNATSPPTRVFSTSVVWPSWRSWTEPSPSPWGGAATATPGSSVWAVMRVAASTPRGPPRRREDSRA